jgi:methionine sulfoxide reductase heme-binding subunit
MRPVPFAARPRSTTVRRWPLHLLVVAVALLPLVWTGYELATQTLQDPAQHLQRATGRWTFRLLLATLAVTPLIKVLGRSGLLPYRRTLGLLTFFYATVHLFTYLGFDFGFDLKEVWVDAMARRFAWIGFTAYLLLVPMAVTSTRGAQRALGRRWKMLHRAIYAIALLAALHYIMLTKVDLTQPLLYAAAVLALLGWRVLAARQRRSAARRAAL